MRIELDQPLPFADGQAVNVRVEPVDVEAQPGSPALILDAMRSAPHLVGEDVDAFDRALAEGRLPVRDATPYDSD